MIDAEAVCGPGKHISDTTCTADVCFCDGGFAATGADCETHGDEKCVSCDSGHVLLDTENCLAYSSCTGGKVDVSDFSNLRFSDGLNHTSTNNDLHVPAFAINGKYTGSREYVHPYYENDDGVRDDFHIDVRATTGIGYINIYRVVL